MKITYPHMGYSYVAFKMLIDDLGYEAVVPPEPSKRTMDLGVGNIQGFSLGCIGNAPPYGYLFSLIYFVGGPGILA